MPAVVGHGEKELCASLTSGKADGGSHSFHFCKSLSRAQHTWSTARLAMSLGPLVRTRKGFMADPTAPLPWKRPSTEPVLRARPSVTLKNAGAVATSGPWLLQLLLAYGGAWAKLGHDSVRSGPQEAPGS